MGIEAGDSRCSYFFRPEARKPRCWTLTRVMWSTVINGRCWSAQCPCSPQQSVMDPCYQHITHTHTHTHMHSTVTWWVAEIPVCQTNCAPVSWCVASSMCCCVTSQLFKRCPLLGAGRWTLDADDQSSTLCQKVAAAGENKHAFRLLGVNARIHCQRLLPCCAFYLWPHSRCHTNTAASPSPSSRSDSLVFLFFFLCFILLPTSVLEQAPGSWVVKKRGNIAEVLQVLLALERRGQRLRKTQMIVSDGLSVM